MPRSKIVKPQRPQSPLVATDKAGLDRIAGSKQRRDLFPRLRGRLLAGLSIGGVKSSFVLSESTSRASRADRRRFTVFQPLYFATCQAFPHSSPNMQRRSP
jgi:hypothetical protein